MKTPKYIYIIIVIIAPVIVGILIFPYLFDTPADGEIQDFEMVQSSFISVSEYLLSRSDMSETQQDVMVYMLQVKNGVVSVFCNGENLDIGNNQVIFKNVYDAKNYRGRRYDCIYVDGKGFVEFRNESQPCGLVYSRNDEYPSTVVRSDLAIIKKITDHFYSVSE